jgi:hypothetical protein
MKALFGLLAIPVVFLNFTGGIVGGIWLAALGQWWLVGFGLAAAISATMLLGVLLMPRIVFAAPAAYAIERGNYLIGILSGIISLSWTYVVMIAWCVITFSYVVDQAKNGSIWPYLLWAYSVATGPWTYMASQDARVDPDSQAPVTAFFCCLGVIAMMSTYFATSKPTIFIVGLAFVVPMAVCFLFQIIMYAVGVIGQARYARPW